MATQREMLRLFGTILVVIPPRKKKMSPWSKWLHPGWQRHVTMKHGFMQLPFFSIIDGKLENDSYEV